MKTIISVLLTASLLTGCAATITTGGSTIRQINADWASECSFIGVVQAREAGGFTAGGQADGALNRIRQEVFNAGGDAYVITNQTQRSITTIQADAYICNQ